MSNATEFEFQPRSAEWHYQTAVETIEDVELHQGDHAESMVMVGLAQTHAMLALYRGRVESEAGR